MARRRDFLLQLGALATAMAIDPDEMRAASAAAASSDTAWDTSWIAALATASFKVVFNGNEIGDGDVLYHAGFFLDHFATVHGTHDEQTRPVIVFRHKGTVLAFNDMLWDKYEIGAEQKVDDPGTKKPARRNIYWKAPAGADGDEAGAAIEPLMQRGLISLVCNVAMTGWSARKAKALGRDAKDVRADVLANLVPGAILVPSGVYGLIRAQNAGCAYMPGA